ncbi:MAG: DEAD/DEAH box helicase family protein [Actinomycetota bacterium]
MKAHLPAVFAVDKSVLRNPLRQLSEEDQIVEGKLSPWSQERSKGYMFRPDGDGDPVLIVNSGSVPEGHQRVLKAKADAGGPRLDLSQSKWIRHPQLPAVNDPVVDLGALGEGVVKSWAGAFSYAMEGPDVVGLRPPQVGAIHAIHAHWTVSEGVATIVMPTGTGKTEVMLSILVSRPCSKVLVVVPTDALRKQIVGKFLTLGVLKSKGSTILAAQALRPIVCSLEHIPRTVEEVDEIFGAANVVVTTSSVAGAATEEVQQRMASLTPYLFVDEAHHVEAPTWSEFKQRFDACRVLQFTATPFREDGKPLDGSIIFKYPLRKAQEENYFTKIRFERVVEFNRKRADAAIAKRAIEVLRAEKDKGHILMARVASVARAKEVFELYKPHEEFKPVELHTGIKSSRAREEARQAIVSGESRIVVCVDMLGEGFDLPELKIAAFHDIRKTLAVTLQLAGRFTRTRPDLGEATFIANTADLDVQDELRKLYARDPDWNVLLPEMSERLIGEQLSLQEFLSGFTAFADEVPLRSVRPALSTVVYRTDSDAWTPENFAQGIPGLSSCEQVHHAVNEAAHTLVVVTARRVALPWTDVEALYGWQWELYVAIWSPEQKLLYVNGSTNAGNYKALADALVEDARLIDGQVVFRAFSGVKRLQLQNVGLSEMLGRNIRYTGRMGGNVGGALSETQRRRTRKSVLAGSGYEGGSKTTVGASRKGRIWSHRRDRVNELSDWCQEIGAKLLDESIDADEVLRGTLEAKPISERPSKMPIVIDWPEEVYTSPESQWWVIVDGEEHMIDEVEIELSTPTMDGALGFAVLTEGARVECELELFEDDENPDYRFKNLSGQKLQIRKGERTEPTDGVAFFNENPPVIWFHDGSCLEGSQYIELKHLPPAFAADRIEAWTWEVDITKESQGPDKQTNTVQAQVIAHLRSQDYTLVFDDDARGEAADVVAVRLVQEDDIPKAIEVDFFHLKFSSASTAGGRVGDLYEVCGQAQKSIGWMNDERKTDLFTHLLRREARRREEGLASRIEVGDEETLHTLREVSRLCPVRLSMCIVQPGLSKERVSGDQLTLLGVTEDHLMDTFQIPLRVVGSD